MCYIVAKHKKNITQSILSVVFFMFLFLDYVWSYWILSCAKSFRYKL